MVDSWASVVLAYVAFIQGIYNVAVRPDSATVIVVHPVVAPRHPIRPGCAADDLGPASINIWVHMQRVVSRHLCVFDQDSVARSALNSILAVMVNVAAAYGVAGLDMDTVQTVPDLAILNQPAIAYLQTGDWETAVADEVLYNETANDLIRTAELSRNRAFVSVQSGQDRAPACRAYHLVSIFHNQIMIQRVSPSGKVEYRARRITVYQPLNSVGRH